MNRSKRHSRANEHRKYVANSFVDFWFSQTLGDMTDSPVAFGDGLAAVTRRREPGGTHAGLGGPGGGPGDPLGGFNALRTVATVQSVER